MLGEKGSFPCDAKQPKGARWWEDNDESRSKFDVIYIHTHSSEEAWFAGGMSLSIYVSTQWFTVGGKFIPPRALLGDVNCKNSLGGWSFETDSSPWAPTVATNSAIPSEILWVVRAPTSQGHGGRPPIRESSKPGKISFCRRRASEGGCKQSGHTLWRPWIEMVKAIRLKAQTLHDWTAMQCNFWDHLRIHKSGILNLICGGKRKCLWGSERARNESLNLNPTCSQQHSIQVWVRRLGGYTSPTQCTNPAPHRSEMVRIQKASEYGRCRWQCQHQF